MQYSMNANLYANKAGKVKSAYHYTYCDENNFTYVKHGNIKSQQHCNYGDVYLTTVGSVANKRYSVGR